MKTSLPAALLFVVGAFSVAWDGDKGVDTREGTSIAWSGDYGGGMKNAKEAGKPVLLYFGGPW